jgi:competence protein ComEC
LGALIGLATTMWVNGAYADPDGLYLRVVDVGAGLCVVAVTPDGHSMVYDAGRGSKLCTDAVRELVPAGKIDLLVLSHSDIDHVGATQDILEYAQVATIIHPGDPRGPALTPIRQAIADEGADEWNLQDRGPALGQTFPVGEATASFVAGWPRGNDTRGPNEPALDEAGRNNALSIVLRIEYRGHSVLLTGDTVGRPISSNDSLCRYAERIMVDRVDDIPLQSDVLIGQHHGGDNATSNCFIRAVRPQFVVFSAGHAYRHPRQSVADRLVANGVNPERIFRTDRGDQEPGTGRQREWVTGSLIGCEDKPGDDDVEVVLPTEAASVVQVRYRHQSFGC